MEITIYYDEHCISTTINKSVKVSDILNGVKEYFNEKNAEFSIVDENKISLPLDKMIIPDKSKKDFYLFKLPSYPKEEEKKDKISIETLIMTTTKAKKPLVNVRYNKASYNPYEVIDLEKKEERDDRDNNLNGSFDLLRFLNSLSNRVNYDNDNDNNNNIAPNESHLSTLKEMGFPEDQARNALIQARNNLARATDILIQGNEVQNESEENNQNNNNNQLNILDELF